MVNIATRPLTVSAQIDNEGQGEVKAQSGARMALAARVRDEGMTPLELMDAALAGCLVLSARIAAKKFGWHDRLKSVSVDVTHTKGEGEPSRVAQFSCDFEIRGDFTQEERLQLIAESHAVCTVGNTLERGASIVDTQ